MAEGPLRVALVHPSMGLGGAERWVVDAALALKQRGHKAMIWTAGLDLERCFEPLIGGQLDVRVRASWLPETALGRLRAPCNLARVAALSMQLARAKDCDVVIADLVSHTLPILRRAGLPTLFYCHYPDRLLTPRRHGLYRIYRRPIDALEEWGLAAADRVLVNSRFTAEQYRKTFPLLPPPGVLYPGVAVEEFHAIPPISSQGPIRLLVLGRFDPAKNLEMAVQTLAVLLPQLPEEIAARVRLDIAGGLDRGRPEASRLTASLERLAEQLGVASRVSLIANPTDDERATLLAGCRCVIYTPRGEHFGLVPLEAMAAGRPVAAVEDGGPKETIVDGEGGKLTQPSPAAFAEAIRKWLLDPEAARAAGEAGRRRAQSFARDRFGEGLERELRRTIAGNRARQS